MLRTLRSDDQGTVLSLLSDERVLEHMLFPRFTQEMASKFTERFQDSAPVGTPPQVVRAIVDATLDNVVGLCGLVLDAQRSQGEVWYLLSPTQWGRGIVTAATRELVSHGFAQLGLHRIWASCLPENPASARVLEKLGFRREGTHLANLHIRGSWRDSFTYAVLASEWTSTSHAS